MSKRAAATPQDESRLPAQSVRTAVSFLLFVHLFALFVAFFSNEWSSAFLARLKSVPGVELYLDALLMDLSYRYHLTAADRLDVDFQVEVQMAMADGAKKTVRLPARGTMLPERYRRYERLAYTVAERQNTQAGGASELMEALAARLFAEQGAARGRSVTHTVRARGHLLQGMDDVQSSDPALRNPFHRNYYWTAYEAAAWNLPGGEVELLPTAEAGDTAQPTQQPSS